MDADLAKLREIAAKATPGSWEWVDDQMVTYKPYTDGSKGRGSRLEIIETDSGVYPPEANDRVFIATFNPSVVKALLDVCEATRAYIYDDYDKGVLPMDTALAALAEKIKP